MTVSETDTDESIRIPTNSDFYKLSMSEQLDILRNRAGVTASRPDSGVLNDRGTMDDRIHLLTSCLKWGGVRELLGDDLHDRALDALSSLQLQQLKERDE